MFNRGSQVAEMPKSQKCQARRSAYAPPALQQGAIGLLAAMPCDPRPRLILVPLDHRIMPNTERANGKGQSSVAAMPACQHPSPPYNRGSLNLRRDAVGATPPLYFGATTSSQKCQLLIAPMGRVIDESQQCHIVITLPHLTTGSHGNLAEMPL